MTKSFIIALSILFPSFIFGQTYKGKLTHDSLTNIYTYKQACLDELIIGGEPTIIKQIGDVKIYAIKIDTIYFGSLFIGQGKCKTVFICVNNSILVQDSTIYCLTSLHYYTDSLSYLLYDYYELNGRIENRSKNIVFQPFRSNGETIFRTDILMKNKNKRNKKDKYEKAIQIWKKKNCL